MVGRFEEISRETSKAKQRLTQRVPTKWDSAAPMANISQSVASSFFLLSSRVPPAHQLVMQAVSLPNAKRDTYEIKRYKKKRIHQKSFAWTRA